MKFILIGCGKVGTAFTYHLEKNDHQCVGVIENNLLNYELFSKNIRKIKQNRIDDKLPKTDFIIIAVNDDEIENIANKLCKNKGLNTKHIFHTSGFLSSNIFRSIKSRKVEFHSIHPLISMPNVKSAIENLPKAYFAIEGENNQWMNEIVEIIGGKSFKISGKEKPYYHVSAVIIGNLLVGLLKMSTVVADRGNISEMDYMKYFSPLIQSVLENVKTNGIDLALSGPIQRNDKKLIEKQIELLKNMNNENILEIYRELVKYLQK